MNDKNEGGDKFDQYEFVALIVPGAILLCGVAVLVGQFSLISDTKDLSVGGLGLFVILAYVAGHLTGAVGEIIEAGWWRARGMPTDRILRGTCKAFGADAMNDIAKQLSHHGIVVDKLPDPAMDQAQAHSTVRRLYILLQEKKRTRRVDVFNRTYGMLRGLTAAFLILAAVSVAFVNGQIEISKGVEVRTWCALIFLGFAAILSYLRMVHFGWTYAKELFNALLQLEKS